MSCAISFGNLRYRQFFITTRKSCTPFLGTTGIFRRSFLNQNCCLARVVARLELSGSLSTPVPWPSFRYIFIKSLNSPDSVSSIAALGLSCKVCEFKDDDWVRVMFEDREFLLSFSWNFFTSGKDGNGWFRSWREGLLFSTLQGLDSFLASSSASSLSSCCLSAWGRYASWCYVVIRI